MGAIKSDTLRSTLLMIPQVQEARIIEKKLRKLSDLIASGTVDLIKLQSLKTALMQDLLTGKKRVTSLLGKGEN